MPESSPITGALILLTIYALYYFRVRAFARCLCICAVVVATLTRDKSMFALLSDTAGGGGGQLAERCAAPALAREGRAGGRQARSRPGGVQLSARHTLGEAQEMNAQTDGGGRLCNPWLKFQRRQARSGRISDSWLWAGRRGLCLV